MFVLFLFKRGEQLRNDTIHVGIFASGLYLWPRSVVEAVFLFSRMRVSSFHIRHAQVLGVSNLAVAHFCRCIARLEALPRTISNRK